MRLLYQLPGHDPHGYCARLSALLGPLVRPDVDLVVRDIPEGPASLEYAYQEAQVMPRLIDTIRAAEREFDGIVIGCFLDPGIHIAREVVAIPVAGLGQAGLQLGATLGHKMGILAGVRRLVPALEQMVHGYGYDYAVGAIQATDLTVAEMRLDRQKVAERVQRLIERLVEERQIDVVVGGCGSLGEIFAELRATSPLPLIDSRVAALKQLEMLADLHRSGHAKTSKIGLYQQPPAHVFEPVR